MTYHQWIQLATAQLTASDNPTARLDSLVLLEDATGLDRAQLLARAEAALTTAQQSQLNIWLQRRLSHEPLAYIRGHAEFYGRTFRVSPSVLVPRPESEAMIDLLKSLMASGPSTGSQDGQTTVVDIGTGSGALAVTAKLEQPEAIVIATDVDSDCLALARDNAVMLGADIKTYEGNLLGATADSSIGTDGQLILLCNLPYVPDDYPINDAARHEPALALFAGADGLDLYRELFDQISSHVITKQPDYVLTEALSEQHEQLATIAEGAGYRQLPGQDLIQVFQAI